MATSALGLAPPAGDKMSALGGKMNSLAVGKGLTTYEGGVLLAREPALMAALRAQHQQSIRPQLAWELRRGWAWLVAGVIATGIIFSRLYLGAHDVEDVLGGALLGIATLLVFERVRRWDWWRGVPTVWPNSLPN